jgi:hypothetical protein
LDNPDSVNNVITSPLHGVWQKISWNAFAATLLAMQYHISTNPSSFGSPLFRFDKVQYSGKLTGSGDTMELSSVLTFFDENGNQLNPDGTPGTENVSSNANGVRIPLEVLPKTGHSLRFPPFPQCLRPNSERPGSWKMKESANCML